MKCLQFQNELEIIYQTLFTGSTLDSISVVNTMTQEYSNGSTEESAAIKSD